MHHRVSRAASPAASRARVRAKVLLATTCVAIAALTLAACFDRTTAPQPTLAPVPRHDFLGDANWGANNSLASGSYDGTIDRVYGGAPPAAQALGPIIYPTFITANVSGQVRQVPGALQGSNIVREAWSTNDPYFWGSMGFRSNGSVWWPVGPSAILRVVAPIAPFRNDAGGQPTGDWNHCGWAGYALCWTWAGAAHFDFQRIHVDLTLARSPDTTVWQGTAATFTAGMSQTNFPGNPYPVDMSALQWRWISDSTASDSIACQSTSGKTCTRVFMTPGVMYTAAYVNGEAQQKQMHVDVRVPKLELSASRTTLLAPGDSDTFVATGDLPMVIEGWNFAPDTVGGSSPDATVGSTWGACVANVTTCTNYVSRPGTVSVIGMVHGVRRTARLHINVVPPKITLVASKTTLAYGDSSTFTAMAAGTPLIVQGWAFRSDSSSAPTATVGSSWGTCIPNDSECTMVVPASGMVIVTGTVAGYASSDSEHVIVVSSAGCGPSQQRSATNGSTLGSARASRGRLGVPSRSMLDCTDPCSVDPTSSGCSEPCSTNPAAPGCAECADPSSCTTTSFEQMPDGWDDQEGWSSLTPGERSLVWSDLFKWIPRRQQMKDIRAFAITQSQILTNHDNHTEGNEQNAFQHSLWAAKMKEAFGYADAKAWTDAHEDRPRTLLESQEYFDSNKAMDLHNNAVGLAWGPSPGIPGDVISLILAHRDELCWLVGPGASAHC